MADLRRTLHSFINDFWQSVKRHPEVTPEEDTDQYWADFVEEISALCKKYDNHPAVLHTVLGYANYLEHEGCGRERTKMNELNEYNDLMNRIRDLMNRETPVLALDASSDGNDRWQCPICHGWWYGQKDYCGDCGHRITYGDSDE